MSSKQIQSSVSSWKVLAASPLLLSAFWVFRGYHELQRYASVTELFVVLSVLFGCVFLFVSLLHRFVRDSTKTAIISCICLIAFFFYGDIQGALLRSDWEQFSRYRYLLSATFVVVGVAVWTVLITRRSLRHLNSYITTVVLFCLVIEFFGIVRYQNPLKGHKYILDQAGIPPRAAVPPEPRDVYYIILDSYTSAASLKEFWNYDNSDIVHYLKGKGFYVAENARSNYNLTIYSLASSLNMSYLNVPYEKLPNFAYRALPMRDLIQTSRVVQTFKNMSYEIVNLSLFDLQDHRKFFAYPLHEREHVLKLQLFRSTLLGTMIDNLYLNIDPRTPLKVANALREVVAQRSTRPRFIYAHFMIPHTPYFFDREGNLKPFASRFGKVSAEVNQQLYLDQLSFTNKIVKQTVDLIFKNSAQPPIIILQGDHGSWCFDGPAGERESTTILNAIYLPEMKSSVLYDSISPVNSFRLILDNYFQTKLGLLPDKVFVREERSLNVRLLRQ